MCIVVPCHQPRHDHVCRLLHILHLSNLCCSFSQVLLTDTHSVNLYSCRDILKPAQSRFVVIQMHTPSHWTWILRFASPYCLIGCNIFMISRQIWVPLPNPRLPCGNRLLARCNLVIGRTEYELKLGKARAGIDKASLTNLVSAGLHPWL